MYRVEIIKNGIKTHGQDFKTAGAANEWIAHCDSGGLWGPKDYVIVGPTDISQEINARKELNRKEKEVIFGKKIVARTGVICKTKLLNSTDVDSFMSNPLIVSLFMHLLAGNISTFAEKLQSSNVSMFFSQPEKDAVIAECQAFLASLGA